MLFLGPAHCSGPLQELEKQQCVLRTCTDKVHRWRDAVIYPKVRCSFNPAQGGIQFAAGAAHLCSRQVAGQVAGAAAGQGAGQGAGQVAGIGLAAWR